MCEKVSKDYVSTNHSFSFRQSKSDFCGVFFFYFCKNMKLSMCHDHNFTPLSTETSFVHELKPGNVQKAWLL